LKEQPIEIDVRVSETGQAGVREGMVTCERGLEAHCGTHAVAARVGAKQPGDFRDPLSHCIVPPRGGRSCKQK
jgi:hypothetical protein